MFYENYTDTVSVNSIKTTHVKSLTRAECIANDLYSIKFKQNDFSNKTYASDDGGVTCSKLWQRRLAHLNYNDVQLLFVTGVGKPI